MKHTIFKTKAPLDRDARADWLADFANRLKTRFINKYECGQLEHRGDLGEVPVLDILDEIWCEQLDLIAYMAELKRRIVGEETRDMIISKQLLTHLYGLANSVREHRKLTKLDSENLAAVKELLVVAAVFTPLMKHE